MMDGFWTMTYFVEDQGELPGGGILIVEDGRVRGGDSGMFWTGTVTLEGAGVDGTLHAEMYRDFYEPIFPGFTERTFTLRFKGGFAEDTFQAAAWIEGRQELACSVRLTKRE